MHIQICEATWIRGFKLPWREAGPPNHHDDEVNSDQQVVNKKVPLSAYPERVPGAGGHSCASNCISFVQLARHPLRLLLEHSTRPHMGGSWRVLLRILPPLLLRERRAGATWGSRLEVQRLDRGDLLVSSSRPGRLAGVVSLALAVVSPVKRAAKLWFAKADAWAALGVAAREEFVMRCGRMRTEKMRLCTRVGRGHNTCGSRARRATRRG